MWVWACACCDVGKCDTKQLLSSFVFFIKVKDTAGIFYNVTNKSTVKLWNWNWLKQISRGRWSTADNYLWFSIPSAIKQKQIVRSLTNVNRKQVYNEICCSCLSQITGVGVITFDIYVSTVHRMLFLSLSPKLATRSYVYEFHDISRWYSALQPTVFCS